jgi:hypothetical protein
MKTYWLMLVASVVLTAAVVCLVIHQMSRPDSTGKQQVIQPVPKQNVHKNITDKKLISEPPAPLTAVKPIVNPGEK